MKVVLKIQDENRTFRTEVTNTALSSCQNENLKIKQILFTYKEDTFKTSSLAEKKIGSHVSLHVLEKYGKFFIHPSSPVVKSKKAKVV